MLKLEKTISYIKMFIVSSDLCFYIFVVTVYLHHSTVN
jgi:hypothetical protein